MSFSSIIVATGKCLPGITIKNDHFLDHKFLEKNGDQLKLGNASIINKFQAITDIEERRYAPDDMVTSDLGHLAAEEALVSGNIDRESLDYIIVAHNFGDVKHGGNRMDMVPSLASRIKFKLGITNPNCVAYDLPFGCPGWLQGVIQSDYYIRSGDAKKIMVIGAETLSRVIDPHDRDSMIYADGAGATILQAEENSDRGVLAHKSQTHTQKELWFLRMENSSNKSYEEHKDIFLKMDGRKVYEYALINVPMLMKEVLDKAGVSPSSLSKVLVHQANGKMLEAILQRLFAMYETEVPANIMPMTISKLGNTSVASLPTMLDVILKSEMDGQQLAVGDLVLFVSVGAGMNINALLYRF